MIVPANSLEIAERAARAGGEVLREWADRITVREKGPADLVTEADLASQEAVRQVVLAAFPDHGFLGEEGPAAGGDAEYRWIVDPLDGTTNYVHGVPQFAVSVALAHGDRPVVGVVYDPTSDECFTAARGQGTWLNGRRLSVSRVSVPAHALVAVSFAAQVRRGAPEIDAFVEMLLASQAVRRLGSAALNLAWLAAGRFDAVYATDTKAWDVAAGYLLVEEAGGMVTGLDGKPATLSRPRFLATATPELHQAMWPLLNSVTEG